MKKQNLKVKKLKEYKEKIYKTSFHHMQTESSIKQLLSDLVDILIEAEDKKEPKS